MKKNRRKYYFILICAVGILIFIGVTLAGFYSNIQERVYKKQIENIKDVSMQGSAVVEKDLEGHVNTLYSLTEFIEKENISDQRTMERLAAFIERNEIGFQRLGLADDQGNARVTNGEVLNISDRDYFQTCMKKGKAATEIRQSKLINEKICIIAVPIQKEDKVPVGVLYGVIEIEVFQIYDNTIMEGKTQYIQIIDLDGNYIMQEESSLLGKRDNIFEGFKYVDSQISQQEIKKKIRNEQQVYTEVTDGTAREIVYFSPLKINDWCVVTVVDFSEVTDSVDYILGNDAYLMILKIILGLLVLGGLFMYFSWQERKKIKEFNEQLVLNEQIVRMAAEKSGFIIMSYDIRSRQLRLMNNTLQNIDICIPEQIDNAPEEFLKYISADNEKLKEQVTGIFKSMEHETGKREFTVSFVNNSHTAYLRLQLFDRIDKNGEPVQCIGVIEDATEKQKLREKADRDSLTGLFNRGTALEHIEKCLSMSDPAPGTVFACMVMDLDNFKTLNDTLGHQTGDLALQDVARILMQHFREYDVVCRLGGDEFLVFMKDIPESVIHRNVESLLKKLTLTYRDSEKTVQISASAGIALVCEGHENFRELYRKADLALYEVKHGTKNSYKIYGKVNAREHTAQKQEYGQGKEQADETG